MTREERFKIDMIAEFKQICKMVERNGVIIQYKSKMLKTLEEEPQTDNRVKTDLNGIKTKLKQEPKEWIPVSERLPEPMQIVLICQKYKTNKYQPVTVAQFNGKYFMWYGYQKNWGKHTNICEHGDICPGNEYVDAWMSLPEPYKESEGKDSR